MTGARPATTSVVLASVLALVIVSNCAEAPSEPTADGAWVGTITTEGNVTTVVNESGSLWAGKAELVEDLSIGVEAGADEYMFGRIVGLGTTEDRLYVADHQSFVIRVYDLRGNHLFDFGSEGQGPGEFDSLGRLTVDPRGGRVLVQGNDRVSVFDLDGNLLDTWRFRDWSIREVPLVVGDDLSIYVPTSWMMDGHRRPGVVVVSPEGDERDRIEAPQLGPLRWLMCAEGPGGDRVAAVSVPYMPDRQWTLAASGAVVVGTAESYSFSVTGSARQLVIERRVSLPEVPAAQRDWHVARATRILRRFEPGWNWDGPPVPQHVPPYLTFHPDRYGRIWVLRQIGFEPADVCDPDPSQVEDGFARSCFEPIHAFDAFAEEDGRFLGQVRVPGALRASMGPRAVPIRAVPNSQTTHWARDAMWWAAEDDNGTIVVKRHRLVLPEDREE